ncbi:MAG: UDP-glucose 4-epimerase GalE [Chlamydiota bacterium]
MSRLPVIVTGGAGYIGCHCCKALYHQGFYPITYDNLSSGHSYAVQWGPLVVGDILDKEKLHQLFSTYRPIAVIHFAALAIVSESMIAPEKYYKNNLAGTLSLLEAMHEFGIKNFLFSSTCATYGNPQFLPITEEHPQDPINPYGKSKWMIEHIIKDYATIHQLRYGILRYFNAAGADPSGGIGENHHNETHLIPKLIEASLQLTPNVPIYGTDFPTRDGSAIRDYIHVEDLANAHVLTLQYLLETKHNLTLNLGTGQGFSVLEIIKALETLLKQKIPVENKEKRAGDPPVLVADNTKVKQILQWEPKISSLDTILLSAWNWHNVLKKNRVINEESITLV